MSAGRFFTDGQELVFTDLNAISSALERQIWQRAVFQMVQRQTNAFFGDSLLTSYAGPTAITVNKGLGLQIDTTQVSPEPYIRPVHLAAAITLNISTPDSALPRIDLVVAQNAVVAELTASRNVKDAVSSTINAQTLTLQNDWVGNVQIVSGTPATSPVAPAVPSGFILLATLQVGAVTGMASASAVQDNRVLMPLGALTAINTSSFVSLTQGTAQPVQTVLAQIDQLLKTPSVSYLDLAVLTQAPVAPAAGKLRLYDLNNVNYVMNANGVATPLGSGAGGGGSLRWNAPQGIAPIDGEEYGDRVFFFENTFGQKITAYLKVPSTYIKGRGITLNLEAYSASAANNWQIQGTAFLFRQGLDGVNSTANASVVALGDVVNTKALVPNLLTFAFAPAGTINNFAVSPGDLLRFEITRIAAVATASEDSSDIRVIPNSTEVTFA